MMRCCHAVQVEVEQQFMADVQLNAIYNPRYWLNLARVASSSSFFWSDGLYTPGPDVGTGYYRHWGEPHRTALAEGSMPSQQRTMPGRGCAGSIGTAQVHHKLNWITTFMDIFQVHSQPLGSLVPSERPVAA